MRSLSFVPKLLDIEKKTQALTDWFTTVSERFRVYTGIGPLSPTEVPQNQWVVYKDTSTGVVSLVVNNGGVVTSAVIEPSTSTTIVPNTVPLAGQILIGNGTSYLPQSSSGDVTVSTTGVFTIGASKVTYAKMQNISATSRVLGRATAGAGNTEELTVSQVLDFVGGAANGDLLTRSGGSWTRLALGTSGQVLQAGATPGWAGHKEQLANVTLGVAGTTLASGTIPARKFLEIHVFIPGYAALDTASFQFNGVGAPDYRYQWATMAAGAIVFAAGLTAASTDRIKIAAVDTTLSRRVVAHISNDSTITEKLVVFESKYGTGSAATQTTRDLGDGAWISAAATQITSVALVSTSNMAAGTQMTIYGWN